MSHYHAVVWLDSREAHIFHITETEAEKITVRDRKPDKHLHGGGSKGASTPTPTRTICTAWSRRSRARRSG